MITNIREKSQTNSGVFENQIERYQGSVTGRYLSTPVFNVKVLSDSTIELKALENTWDIYLNGCGCRGSENNDPMIENEICILEGNWFEFIDPTGHWRKEVILTE